MSPHIYNQISDEISLDTSKHTKVQGVHVQGQCSVKVSISGHTFEHTLHVLESMSHPLILGEDFLKQNQANIDFSSQTLRSPSVTVNIVHNTLSRVKTIVARSKEGVEMPPKSECVIQIVLNSHKNSQCSDILEPISSLINKCSLVWAKCVVSLKSSTTVSCFQSYTYHYCH